MITFRDRFFGCFFGSILGDVLGMPYEFECAGDFYFDGTMEEGGPFNLQRGYYTDDTSMMIAMADSIIELKKIDMVNHIHRYSQWYRRGLYSSTGECFDIGNQTRTAIEYFEQFSEFLPESNGAGNGSLMRAAPVILYSVNDYKTTFAENIKKSCITTHHSEKCIDYTTRYAELVRDIITEDTSALDKIREIVDSYDYGEEYEATGYIVNSYYASLRSFANTSSFKDCMIDIINIGGDTDTNACIAGMLAGAHYGFGGLPKEWVYNIHNFEYLYRICESLLELVQENAQSH